jgi:hypothetical protein
MQRRSLLGGYPGHDALLPFLMIFSKNPDNRVKAIARAKGFFDENSIV